MKAEKLRYHARQYVKAFVPAKVLQSRVHRRAFTQFAEKAGLVYFGYVDQHHDEHRLVRGFTVSATHKDNNYCIGSFKGYDVTVVERTDILRFPGKPARPQDWLIMTFDLHTPADLPHTFIGLHTHSETFYAELFTKFSHLAKTPMGTFMHLTPRFIHKYAVFTEPARLLQAEHLFDAKTAETIAETFGSLTIELTSDCLYLYAWHQRPTVSFLTNMLQNGLWLAKTIDERAADL
ncbi:MAG TPA: hypothetical protein VIQ80_01440 [Candidatus Saccharimonadales bacterium]